MRRQRKGTQVLALILGLSLLAAACGGDDDDESSGTGDTTPEGVQGGELVDLGTFVGDPPEHIDPGLNSTLDAYQVINSLYDGLTEIDSSDPENPQAVGQVAESFEANDDATVWTFTIRDGLKFSDGTPVLPSSFTRAWERASDPDFAGDYSYLFNFIQGGAEKLDGSADTLEGVVADDDAMTLEVTLSAPYANFPYIAGFQIFMPMPEAVEELSDQNAWENGLMIGNGPFMLDAPRTDQEIVLVPNPEWDGTQYDEALGLPEKPVLDKITFRTSADPDTSYNSFEAGEGDTANLPPGRVQEAEDNYETTLDVQILGSYYFDINEDDPVVGGDDNVLLRQAMSQAIDREEINEAVYEGTRSTSTGVVPPGIPGFGEDLCDYCAYDPEAAQQAYDDWKAEGNELTNPIPIQFNADAGHEPVVDIIIDDLDAIGIPAERQPIDTETYFSQLADGACVVCRAGWYADYPTYDNFMYDLFGSDAAHGGNNYSNYVDDEFDSLVGEAKETTDADEQGDLFRQAEEKLLNEDIAVIPINWYRGDYVYNGDKIANFPQSNLGLITWEMVSLKG
ncbi:MAG TPA: peptide ABC transporter substrate-binding protein [Acidimicrobiales bacterium]